MGVRFDLSFAYSDFHLLPSNVKGFYFSRGKRIPNLYARGVFVQGVCSHIKDSDLGGWQIKLLGISMGGSTYASNG